MTENMINKDTAMTMAAIEVIKKQLETILESIKILSDAKDTSIIAIDRLKNQLSLVIEQINDLETRQGILSDETRNKGFFNTVFVWFGAVATVTGVGWLLYNFILKTIENSK